MKKAIFVIFLTALIFSGCNKKDDSTADIIKDSTSFKELKEQSNKEYKLRTMNNKSIILTVDDEVLSSKDFKNKIVLINFWATWCPPCVKEIPIFNKLYEKYKKDFVIVGILYEKNKDLKQLKGFVHRHNMKFPISISEKENFRMGKNFDNVTKIPESYLYGKDGTFIKKYIGLVDEKDLEMYIKNSLKK